MSTMAVDKVDQVDDGAPPSAGTDPSDSFVASLPDPLRAYATEALSTQKNGEADASARLDRLEIATRAHLLALVEQLLSTDGPASSSAQHDATMETTLRYLKDVTLLCRHLVQRASAGDPSPSALATALVKKLPFLLLEDAVDALPLVRIQSLWSSPAYPTLNIDSYTTTLLCSPELFVPTSKLVLLRICNKLLKVLSNRDVDAEFAGRLMTTMAKVFPLSERSAVNVLGSFNVHNETIFEDEAEFVAKKELGAKAAGTAEGDKGSSIGYDFYRTFWGVQQAFTDPQGTILPSRGGLNQAQAAAAYTSFVKDVTSILAALEGTPLPQSSALSKLDEATSTASSDGDIVRHHKYLTSSQLLHLQLKDATLRLHFLSQLIIILSYLSSPSVALPTPPITAAAGADTAKLLAQIRNTQSKQLAEVEKRTWQLLRATAPPKGEAMHRSLRWLLRERESMWRNWKRGKCLPSMDKVKKSAVDGAEIKTKLSGRKRKVDSMTTAEGPIAKEDLSTSSVPALSDFLEPYVEALDPENGIEGEYHPRNDTVYSWRALRLLARAQAGADKGVGGHLCRFGDLRRRDGDFEGIVRGIWTERGEEIGGSMGEDYYHDIEEAVEEKKALADAEMDDVSVGTPEEDEAARKEKMAEFEKAAMDFEEELLNDEAEGSGDKEEGKAEEGADAAVKMEDKAEADEKDIRDAAAETIMSMFNEEPEKKKDEAAPAEPKKEHAAKQETKSSASEKGKADAAAKVEPKKAPKGQGKNGGGKKDSSSNGKKEEDRRSASPARAKFTPPPPKGQKQKTEDTKNEPRDNARGGRHNHRRTNSDQQNQPSSDRRGSGRGAEKHQPSSDRGRDGSADGRRGARFQPQQQQSQRDARPSGRDGKSRSPPKDTVAHGKGSDHGGGDRRGDRGGNVPAPGKGGDAGGGERRGPPHGGGRGRGNWEPPHGGRGGGGGRGGRGGGRGNYRDRGNRRGGGR